MFFVFIFLFILIAGIVIYLPYVSGIATYKLEKPRKSGDTHKNSTPEYQGYLPPDEELALKREEEESRASGLSKRLNITKKDVPLKLNINGLRKRVNNPTDINELQNRTRHDPNAFDYDIDDLIKEENEKELEEYNSRFNFAANEKDAANRYEELA